MATLGQVMVEVGADMTEFNQSMKQVEKNMKRTSRMMEKHAKAMANALNDKWDNPEFVQKMELMKERMIHANDIMLEKTTTSAKMIKNLDRMNVRNLDQQFLKLGDKLERMALQGNSFNVALNEIGRNASMKDLLEQVQLINTGIARMQALQMGMAIFTGVVTYGMVKLSNAVDGRLIPASKEFVEVWKKALTPFAKAWTTWVVKIVEFGTAIGRMYGEWSEANPILAGVVGNIMYLTSVLMILLSPLAIAISKTGALAVGFKVAWGWMKNFVLGFLAVIGTALIVATVIVGVINAINLMWKHSEGFRKAVTGAWDGIKKAFYDAFNPVIKELGVLKEAFDHFFYHVFGNAKTFEERWNNIGNVVGAVVSFIAPYLTQVLAGAFKLMASIILPIVQLLAIVFEKVAVYIQENGDSISSTFKTIGKVVGFILGFIVDLILTTFYHIQQIIDSSLKIIINLFYLFKNLLSGNWSQAWENFKAIISNALNLVWNLIQVTILGKALKLFKAFGGKVKSALSDVADKIASPFKNGYEKVKGWIQSIKTAMQNMFLGHIKTPKFSFSGSMNPTKWKSEGMPKVKVNWNAKGNIFDGASILGGNQGVGEAGAEVVMPIERRRYMKPYASMVAELLDKMDNDKDVQGNIINKFEIAQIVIREEADIKRIADELERKQRQQTRAKGGQAYA